VRAAPALRTGGIDLDRKKTNAARLIRLRKLETTAPTAAGDATDPSDAAPTRSATEMTNGIHSGDAGDSSDTSSSFGESQHSVSSPAGPPAPVNHEVMTVLTSPVVAEAIRVFEPDEIEVRLTDGRLWAAKPTDDRTSSSSNKDQPEQASEPQRKQERRTNHVPAQPNGTKHT
jgi:hypothetical protein